MSPVANDVALKAPLTAPKLAPGLSLWLDLLRGGSALVVLAGHLAHTRFSGDRYEALMRYDVASDAVIVFFVLSGLVIAYAADRDGSLPRFAFNRLTRLWLVLLPALLLTFVLDQWGSALRPEAYPPAHYTPLSLGDMLARGLSFSTHWRGVGERIMLGTNGPIWSLSYEAAYYALFAFAIFTHGALRLILLAATALIAGVQILALLPVWLMGVWFWRRLKQHPRLSRARAWTLALGPLLLIPLAKAAALHHLLLAATEQALPGIDLLRTLGHSHDFLWSFALGTAITLHLIGMHQLLAEPTRLLQRMAPAIRATAGLSFSLYITHIPVLHAVSAAWPEPSRARDAAMILACLATAALFACAFEHPIGRIRARLRNLAPKRSAIPAE